MIDRGNRSNGIPYIISDGKTKRLERLDLNKKKLLETQLQTILESCSDIIFVDMSAPHLKPRYSAISHLVNCVHPSDVKHVMVNGEFVVWDREIQTFDLEETISKVDEFVRELA
jgi:hypothetical protein